MQNLVAFLSKYYHWLLFLVLELVSVVLLFKYNGYQRSVWLSSANAVTGQIYEWQADVEQFFSFQEANRQLTARNVQLEQELHRLRGHLLTLTDTAAADRVQFDSLTQFRLLEAKVVHATLDTPNNLITIDRGSADGIEPDMGVVSGRGIVGVVYMVGTSYSVVLPVLNSHSKISCAIRGKDYFGMMSWTGGDTRYAFVDGIPRHANLEQGEWVETNGFSAIFPAGVTIGQVVGIQNSRDGQSYRLKVQLATDFSCLRDVCIITDKSFVERIRLERAAADSLSRKAQ